MSPFHKRVKFHSVSQQVCARMHKKGTALQKWQLEMYMRDMHIYLESGHGKQMMEVYGTCAAHVGAKKLDALIQYEVSHCSKMEKFFVRDKIAEQAVAKYKRSQEFKEELKKAQRQQKAQDLKTFNKKRMERTVTQLKKDLAKVVVNDETVVKFGLGLLKLQVDTPRPAERRPKWIGLPTR